MKNYFKITFDNYLLQKIKISQTFFKDCINNESKHDKCHFLGKDAEVILQGFYQAT
tara:strand:+ start:462 stop:629 length:168 start_codon:yes stop_codon:yes gene_type:complete